MHAVVIGLSAFFYVVMQEEEWLDRLDRLDRVWAEVSKGGPAPKLWTDRD